MVDLLALLGGLAVGVLGAAALAGSLRRPPLRLAAAPTAPARSAPTQPAPGAAEPPSIRVNHPGVAGTSTAPPPAAAPPAPAGPTRARLELSDGSGSVELGDEVVTLGRGSDQRLRIPDSRASRAHAVVRPRAKGGWEVKDVGSANGTLLNGHSIPQDRVAPLRHGDRIGIGPLTITYTETSGGPSPSPDGPDPGPDATRVL